MAKSPVPLKKNAKNGEVIVLERRQRVVKMYLEGATQWEIAQREGVSQMTICADLQKAREEWRSRMARSYEERLVEELAKIDNLERIASVQWERSLRDQEVTVKTVERALRAAADEVDEGADGKSRRGRKSTAAGKAVMRVVKEGEEHRRIGTNGDKGFLEILKWCIDTRLKILGAYKEDNSRTVNALIVQWDDLLGRGSRPSDAIEERLAIEALPPQTEGGGA